MHQHVRVVLKIPEYQLLAYYEGNVDTVAAKTIDGRIIHFPANVLRSVVQSHGVYGTFGRGCEEQHKVGSSNRVSD